MKGFKLISSLSALLIFAIAAEATPFFVDFGGNVEVRGITRLDDGRAMVVGYRDVPTTESRNATLFTVAADGTSFTETTLVGLGGDSAAVAISRTGSHIVGYSVSPGSVDIGEGTVWSRVNGWSAQGIGVGDVFASSAATDVASTGTAVGHIEGLRGAVTWSQSTGLVRLQSDFGNGGASGVTDDGSIVVGSGSLALGVVSPLLWAGDGMEVLETIDGNAAVTGISDNGLYISGFANSFDVDTFQTLTNAAIWIDNDLSIGDGHSAADYALSYLLDADGEVFQGTVRAVSDNGYAVGESLDGAFIWHESFTGVRMFDEWLLTEFGINLPTPALAIHDVFFDGINLNFAIKGSSYFVSAPVAGGGQEVPEPATSLLLLAGVGGLARRRSLAKTH